MKAKRLNKSFVISVIITLVMGFNFILPPAVKAAGTPYYVDSTITDTHVASATPDCTNYDPVAFTCSGGSASAYKTVADVDAKSFAAGDQILFRKGQTWRETLTPASSGTAGNPITYGTFGSGAAPVLLGSTALGASSWSLGSSTYTSQQTLGTGCSGNYTPFHFFSNVAASFTTVGAYTLTRVDLGLQIQAGTPLVHPVTAYILSDSAGAPGSVIATSSPTEQYTLTGSVVNYAWYFSGISLSATTRYWVRLASTNDGSSYPLWCGSSGGSEHYYYSSDGASWSLGAATQFDINTYSTTAPPANVYSVSSINTAVVGMVFNSGTSIGHLKASVGALASQGDFYYDGAGQTLYLYSTSNPSSFYTSIEASQRNGVTVSTNYITINGLETDYGDYGVYVQADAIHDVTIQNLTATYNTEIGVLMSNLFSETTTASTNLNISSSTISHNGGHGIEYLFRVQNSTASNNLVDGNGTIPGATGWHGISLYGNGSGNDPSNITITGNTVSNTLQYNGGEGTGIQSDNNSSNITISYNKVFGNQGFGIAAATPSHNDSIFNNVVYNNGISATGVGGIVINNSPNDVVYNNTVYNNYAIGLRVWNSASINTTIKNNIFMDNGTTEIASNDGPAGFVSDYNDIYHTAGGSSYMSWNNSTSNFTNWKTNSSQDAHSLNSDPKFTSTSTPTLTLLATSPAIDAGANLTSTYQLGLNSTSVWPASVTTLNQNSNGPAWDMGAYVYAQSTAPTVSLTAPVAGTVSGTSTTVSATASATAPAAISQVQFLLDNLPLQTADTTSPYSIVWDTTTASNTAHTLLAVATDNYGNVATSSPVTVTVSNTYTIGGNISGLSGTVVLQDNGGDNLSTSTNGSFTFATATSTGGTYNVTVLTQPTGQTCTVSNGSGSVASANVTNVSVSCAPTVDSTPPSIPSGLSATVVSTTEIDLSWAASTDNVGVAGYDIYRNDGLIATTTTLSSADTGLAAGTAYRYYVAAFDAADNVSATSTTATATTQSPAPSGGGGGGGAVITLPTIASFSASPANILPSQSSTLSWILTGASSIRITPSVSTSSINALTGRVTVTPSITTIFTLVAANSYGQSVTATTTVAVMASNGSQPPPSSGPDNSLLPPSTAPAYCLVNNSGTFSLILSGIRHGIANPGLLTSYGYGFLDAVMDTAAYQGLPSGDLLWPDDGALVKAPNSPTVYLISGVAKHGFTSASVFRTLGYKFSSVLTIPAPQLDGLAGGSPIAEPSARHLPGTNISSNGTIYFLGESQRSPYPSLAVFNTWNLHNDFSRVVPASAADLALSLGPVVTPRSSCASQ